MSEKLRPCPFCGAMPDNERGVVRYDPGVICHTKGCLLECRWFPIDDWNTRPIEDALNARIANLEGANRGLGANYIYELNENIKLNARIAELEAAQRWHVVKECNDVATPIDVALRKRIAELEGKIDQLTAHDATERQDDKWIPVSERLPDNWKPVLTIDMSESTRVPVPAFYDPETSLWSTHLPNYDLWVTHWMPLPEPPIVYGKVCEE